jgi:hypothetical protein
MGLTTDMSNCKKCGGESYYIYDSQELREENLCMNDACRFFTIDFDKRCNFDPTLVDKDYSKFLNSLESDEDNEMKYYWGFSSLQDCREMRNENRDE